MEHYTGNTHHSIQVSESYLENDTREYFDTLFETSKNKYRIENTDLVVTNIGIHTDFKNAKCFDIWNTKNHLVHIILFYQGVPKHFIDRFSIKRKYDNDECFLFTIIIPPKSISEHFYNLKDMTLLGGAEECLAIYFLDDLRKSLRVSKIKSIL